MVQRLADELLEKLPPDYNPHEVYAAFEIQMFYVYMHVHVLCVLLWFLEF